MPKQPSVYTLSKTPARARSCCLPVQALLAAKILPLAPPGIPSATRAEPPH